MQYFGTIICIDKIKTDEEINFLQSKVDSLEISEKVAKNDAEQYKKIYNEQLDKINFMNKYIVIVPDNTTIYHRYNCKYLDSSSNFLAFNIDNAKAQGYTPCKHCNIDLNKKINIKE